MNILLYFSRTGRPPAVQVRTAYGEDKVRAIPLRDFARWSAIAYVDLDAPLAAPAGPHQPFRTIGGVFTLGSGSAPMSRDRLLESIAGHYLIVEQQPGGPVSVTTDPLLSIPLYIYQRGDVICLSTRLDWLLIEVGRTWTVTWEQVFSFVLNSSCAGRRIFLEDIRLANVASVYSFSGEGEFETWRYWRLPASTAHGGADPEEAAGILKQTIARSFANWGPVAIPLTAGVDSRLILAAAATIDRSRLRTMTHGFARASHPDPDLAVQVAAAAGVPHAFVDTTETIRGFFDEAEGDGSLHRLLGGQGRHSLVYELMLYKWLEQAGCELELKGLAGGLFKAKWHTSSPTGKITERYTRRYRSSFEGRAKAALIDLDESFDRLSREDRPAWVTEEQTRDWLSFAVRFSNRTAPRTFLQVSRFRSFNPFYARPFLQAYLSIPAERREHAAHHLRMIAYLAPELARLPYLSRGQYWVYKDDRPRRMTPAEISAAGLVHYRKPMHRVTRWLHSRLRTVGAAALTARPPVPSDWDFILDVFLRHLQPVLEQAQRLFPNELGRLSVREFGLSTIWDSRAYRLYSVLKFLTYCADRGVAFR